MTRGVLVMSYGTPASLDDVEAYYTDIRGGRPPPRDLLDELTRRYRAIGGRSPLLDITRVQAAGIDERLDGARAYVGQKHAPPTIPEAVSAMARDGIEDAVGLALAPHYSEMSIGDYERRVAAAAEEAGWRGRFTMVRQWHLEAGFIDLLAERVDAARRRLEVPASEAVVIFTAHSLPKKILEHGDPYPEQLAATAAAVAARAGLERWQVGWQSAGRTEAEWLGPDLLEILVELAATDTRGIVVCPCGFVADHLEVLYDIDVEAVALASELGVRLVRTESPNDDPDFLDVLAGVVERAFSDHDPPP